MKGKKVFVFRGDLCSQTGYGRHIRSLASLVAESYEVFGVDIHPNTMDSSVPFCGVLIEDKDILDLVARCTRRPFVFTYSDPNSFITFPKVFNLAGFSWETSTIPTNQFWDVKSALIDAFWAPTPFNADCIRSIAPGRPIDIIPWAHNFSQARLHPDTVRDRLAPIRCVVIEASDGNCDLQSYWTSLPILRKQHGDIFLAIQSVAPRKGLPVLLSEWCDFCRSSASQNTLLLKISFRHALNLDQNPVGYLINLLRQAGADGSFPLRVALIDSDTILSEEQITATYCLADVFVTATYGEGFGGCVIEALKTWRPVIAPRHTGIAAMLPVDYPFCIDTVPLRLGLIKALDIYQPESVWNIPIKGSLQAAFQRFSATDTEGRKRATIEARRHAQAFCDERVVRSLINKSLEQLEKMP